MTDPDRNPVGVQTAGEGEDLPVGMTGELPVFNVVDLLNIQEHQVSQGQKLLQLLHKAVIMGVIQYAAGVDAGVDAMPLQIVEELDQKIHLHHGFAAGDGDAPAFVEGQVGIKALQHLLHGHLRAAAIFPGVWVMAVLAAHRTALEEDHIADARAVHRPAAFYRMNIPLHLYML